MLVARGGHEVDPSLHPCVGRALEVHEIAADAYTAHQELALAADFVPSAGYLVELLRLDDARRQAENHLIGVRGLASHCDGRNCLNATLAAEADSVAAVEALSLTA